MLLAISSLINSDNKVIRPESFRASAVRRPQQPVERELTRAGIITYFPDNLPDQLKTLFSSSGLLAELVWGGRLVSRGTVDPDWFLEMRITLSNLEGEAIHGMLISDRAEQEDSN